MPDSTSAASRFSYVMTTFSCFEKGNFSHKLTHSDGPMGLTRIAMNDHGVASLCFPKDLPAETAPASVAPAIAASLQLRCCAAAQLRCCAQDISKSFQKGVTESFVAGLPTRHGTAWDRLGPPGAGKMIHRGCATQGGGEQAWWRRGKNMQKQAKTRGEL